MLARPPRAYRQESFEVAPLFGRDRGCNDVSCDGAFPFEEIVDLVRFGVDWDELRHWLAVLGDHDSFVRRLDLIHDRKTVCLEGTCRHLLHTRLRYNYGHYTMVVPLRAKPISPKWERNDFLNHLGEAGIPPVLKSCEETYASTEINFTGFVVAGRCVAARRFEWGAGADTGSVCRAAGGDGTAGLGASFGAVQHAHR